MGLMKEFKEFAMKGNIIDLAVGVVIGGAFQTIVTSLVNDIIMPFTGLFTGSVDYEDWVINIFDGAAQIQIGSFITAIINFLLIAFSIFIALKYINKLNKKIEYMNKVATEKIEKESVEPLTKVCPYCLSEIPYKAVKCSRCTSDVPLEETVK